MQTQASTIHTHTHTQVLRELYNLTFVTGSPTHVVDVVSQLLAVPCPSAATGQVGGRVRRVCVCVCV